MPAYPEHDEERPQGDIEITDFLRQKFGETHVEHILRRRWLLVKVPRIPNESTLKSAVVQEQAFDSGLQE